MMVDDRFFPVQLDSGDWGVRDRLTDDHAVDDLGPYDSREIAYLTAASLNSAVDRGQIEPLNEGA